MKPVEARALKRDKTRDIQLIRFDTLRKGQIVNIRLISRDLH